MEIRKAVGYKKNKVELIISFKGLSVDSNQASALSGIKGLFWALKP